MSRVIALCFLLLAAVIGFLHIDSRPVWAPFTSYTAPPVEEELEAPPAPKSKNQSAPSKAVIASPISTWLPETGAPSVHAASLITLNDGAHIYLWMDAKVVEHDEIIANKAAYLNPVFFWIRTLVYFATYIIFLRGFQKRSAEEDRIGGTDLHFQNYKKGAMFLVFFAVFSSTSAWDWLMSIDVHWFSTLYGWYTFAGMWCSTMVVLVLTTLYLKKLGYLQKVNDSHIHDLGKWTFATSFLWSYLWFSQFMLIWYANIPEETVYFKHRVQGSYKGIFFLNLIINFLCPLLILMKRSAKRNYTLVAFMAVLILFGHWIDFYQMVMGSLSKEHVTLGWLDFGILSLFVGLMIFFVSRALASKPLIPKSHPFLKESIIHQV